MDFTLGAGSGRRRDEKFAVAQQEREMDFTREQNITKSAQSEEQLDLVKQEEKSNLIRWQQELDGELFNLVCRFKGYAYDEDGRLYLPPNATPICNDLFIDTIVIPQCKPFLSRNFINSNFEEDRLLRKLKLTHNDIVSNMCDGWDVYKIEFMNYNNVTRVLKNFIDSAGFRALRGWTKKTDSTIHKHISSEMDGMPRKPDRKLFGFGG